MCVYACVSLVCVSVGDSMYFAAYDVAASSIEVGIYNIRIYLLSWLCASHSHIKDHSSRSGHIITDTPESYIYIYLYLQNLHKYIHLRAYKNYIYVYTSIYDMYLED